MGGEDVRSLAAAAAYDYDGDPRWLEYWSNVLIPPRLASRPGVVDHFKLKFYKRYIDPNFIVKPMSSTTASYSARSSGSPTGPESADAVDTGPSISNGRSARSGTYSSSVRSGHSVVQFAAGTWQYVLAKIQILFLPMEKTDYPDTSYQVLFSIFLCIIPAAPKNISSNSYRFSLLGTVFSSSYSLCSIYGVPRNLTGMQTWIQSIVMTKDFTYLLYCLMFIPFHVNFKFALVPLICWEIELTSKFLKCKFNNTYLYRKLFDRNCSWVEENRIFLNNLSSDAEIAQGFLLILSLFSSQRNIIQTFIYWHLLKLMYHAPATAGFHQAAWARIDHALSPFVRYIPFLKSPLSAIRRWWVS